MIAIGHDVIDLQLAKKESNIFRSGYLDKIMTENEQQMLQDSTDKENFFWQIWSIKESVYKILRQKGEERGYYPKKIEVLNIASSIKENPKPTKTQNSKLKIQNLSPITEKSTHNIHHSRLIAYNNQIFYSQTTFSSNYLETIALENQLDFKKIKRLNQTVKLFKVNEIPFLLIDNKCFAVSKSHHGRFESLVTIM